MQLLDHVSITVRDLTGVRPFYLAVMAELGACVAYDGDDGIGFGERNRPDDDAHTYLSVFESPQASTDAKRHWCFRAASTEQVDAFYHAGLRAGGKSAGAPGVRDYHEGYYAAFLLDAQGNKIEAVYHRAKP